MNRRQTLKLLGATAVAVATTLTSRFAFAAEPTMVVVVKIAGIPWFNALEKGIQKGGKDFSINATMVGPANVDPAQQVKLLEDLIAKKVDVIGLVPLDVKVCEPVLKRAQAAGIKVITHEGPEQEGRDWNVELIDSVQVRRSADGAARQGHGRGRRIRRLCRHADDAAPQQMGRRRDRLSEEELSQDEARRRPLPRRRRDRHQPTRRRST